MHPSSKVGHKTMTSLKNEIGKGEMFKECKTREKKKEDKGKER